MTRLAHAFRAFFSLLFQGRLAADIAAAHGYSPKKPAPPTAAPAPPPPAARTSDGALQMLGILQRDSRLVDFLMEDITSYSDDQVGAAVRALHGSCRDSLKRYVTLGPVIDGVEGTFTQITGALAKDPNALKLMGNVPPDGKAPGGTLRHRGWRAQKIELPPLTAKQDPSIVAPAEIEIE